MGVGKKFYNHPGETIEVVIRDQTGARIEKRTCKADDEKETVMLGRWLQEKYGIRLISKKKDKEQTTEWLNPEGEFLKIE